MNIVANNTEFYAEISGEGESVIFVHGSGSDYRTWIESQNELAKDFHTLNYSRRFHHPNKSIKKDEDYSMAEHLADLEEIIERQENTPVHLIGHSYGAFLCLLLAIEKPKLIKSLVLTEPPIFTLYLDIPPNPLDILKLIITKPRTAFPIINFARNGLNPATKFAKEDDMDSAFETFSKAILGSKTFNNLSKDRLEQARRNSFKAELLGSGFLSLNQEDIENINIPTLVINGTNSPTCFEKFVEQLHKLIPNSEHSVISNASHIVHEDNFDRYIKDVYSFLSENKN